jgi:hypothetical protein
MFVKPFGSIYSILLKFVALSLITPHLKQLLSSLQPAVKCNKLKDFNSLFQLSLVTFHIDLV